VLHKLQFFVELLNGGVCGAVPNTPYIDKDRGLEIYLLMIVTRIPIYFEFRLYIMAKHWSNSYTHKRVVHENTMYSNSFRNRAPPVHRHVTHVTPSVLRSKQLTKTIHEHHIYVILHVINCVDRVL
jgi:hypothetical protein